ncbi:Wzz/FepE/Etk N-terminal domain-containing protein [Marinobacter halotolerans]|uniref:Wzz/FepE/Etk N-terminal domain-containing protein n=1 Tax=Marinobacter halotolerans TaxID=1569211 RepID=UPI001245AD6A|nr:Wzz/FepE/Etk N-terminal domain-containing protein [Marinobacter halotolerans]
MNQGPEQNHYSDDEIDLRALFATLWRGKWTILATTFLFAVAGVAYALSKPNIYQASVLLAPAQDESGGSLGGQLGGLASLAGINIGGGGANQTVVAKEVLQSHAFLASFIRRHNLKIPLMAAKAWDTEKQNWVIDRKIYNPNADEWQTGEDGISLEPTAWDMVKKFKEDHLAISNNIETGMVTISVKSKSPPAAKNWAELLVNDVNEHMRRKDVKKAQARIAYLEAKLNQTGLADMKQVFYQLIESETRTVMLASAHNEYVFETIDPPVAPQDKSEPNRAFISVISTLVGGVFGVLIVFLLRVFRRN